MAYGGIIQSRGHSATFLKRNVLDGKIRVFEDEKGGAERAEILIPEGKVVIIKDYEEAPQFAKYQRVDCYSLRDELLGTLTIIQDNRFLKDYRFYDGNMPLGRGNGDIVAAIAQKLLGEEVMDPRYVAGSTIDAVVVETIKHMFPRKLSDMLK